MTVRVSDKRKVSEAFSMTNRVNQGCVLAPNLFSLMLSVMLMDAHRDEHPGIRIAYGNDGHLNSQRMQAPTRMSTTIGLRVESPRYSPEHKTEDVQGRRPDDTPLRSENLDHLLEPS
ncbi:unnamed protein product [Schistocephalus solidus]|uniref:Reverse transcriptase domain-containing protein n=1 Tax=Schistocephalus solidus TaxID=70667 RepID=A0A183TNX2_SCHSO|nr:unnamed protein product [Schistocephalus solidus]